MDESDAEQVIVPACYCPLTEDEYALLLQEIDPLTDSENYGIDVFSASVIFVEDLLSI